METFDYTHEGIELEVEYKYEPGEKAIPYYGDGSGYPGSGPVITIHHIWTALSDNRGHLVRVDVMDIVQADGLDLDVLEEDILESIE